MGTRGAGMNEQESSESARKGQHDDLIRESQVRGHEARENRAYKGIEEAPACIDVGALEAEVITQEEVAGLKPGTSRAWCIVAAARYMASVTPSDASRALITNATVLLEGEVGSDGRASSFTAGFADLLQELCEGGIHASEPNP